MIAKFYHLIAEATKRINPSWPIVFANQNMPRPPKPYLLLNVLNIDIPDHVIYIDPTTTSSDTVTIYGWRKASVEIQVYNGINSLTTINTLALILQITPLLDFQYQIDCAIGQRLFIGYIPELLNESQFEGRGIYQFEFMYTENYSYDEYDIRKVKIHGDYSGSLTEGSCDEIITSPAWVEPTP